ncbi:MAG TPA: HEAT repeat domain-containing protein [Gemmatimonadota bacterium]|nr:HEAT repeat domain-containing protein [Gemmatimonadota bacterium]
MRRLPLALGAAAALAAAVLAAALRDGEPPALNGAPVQPLELAVPADSLAADLLERIRGLDPVACELAVGSVRSRSWRGGPPEPAASEDPRVLAVVRWALEEEGGDGAVPVLAAGLADPDPCVRRVAAIRLGRIDDPAASELLRRALESPEPGAREAGALGLGIAEDSAAVPALIARLEGDDSPRVRRAAAWALGEME